MTKHILIATPAYGGMVCSDFTKSLIHTCELLSMNKIEYTIKFINNQLVTRARNMLADIFMRDEKFTHMLFIDSDIKWHPTHVMYLLSHNEECVVGIYPNKGYIWKNDELIVMPSSNLGNYPNDPKKHLLQIKHGATGFMLLTKSALKRIENDVDYFYLPSGNGKRKLMNYFDCNVIDHDYLTEDYYFCFLFNKNGGKIYTDKRIALLHIGSHEYGSLVRNKK